MRKPKPNRVFAPRLPELDAEEMYEYDLQAAALSDNLVGELAQHMLASNSGLLSEEEYDFILSDDLKRRRQGLALAFYAANLRWRAAIEAEQAVKAQSWPFKASSSAPTLTQRIGRLNQVA